MRATLKVLNEITGGGCSKTTKMPVGSTSNGLPTDRCNTGGRLQAVPGSVCHGCYADHRGNYRWQNVQDAQERRFQALDHPQWVEAMAELLNRGGAGLHRWHDSGDIRDVTHLAAIAAVAVQTPGVRHWLPTKEYGLARKYREWLPSNVVLRVSAPMVGERLDSEKWGTTSMVLDKGQECPDDVWECPAPKQGGMCGECRACWDPEVSVVAYHKH